MPPSVIFRNAPWRAGVGGTVWNGEVGIVGGHRLSFEWAPLRSIGGLGLAMDWRIIGPRTDLSGRALFKPSGRMVLDDVVGQADWSLIGAFQPRLPFRCDGVVAINLPRVALFGGDRMIAGRMDSQPGTCAPLAGGGAVPVPALNLSTERVGANTRMTLAPAGQRRLALFDATLEQDGEIELRLTPAGSTAIAFIGMPAGPLRAAGL